MMNQSDLLLLRDRLVTFSSPLKDSGPIRPIWFPVMNRFLVYPGMPAGTLRRSLETHFTVCAASEHSHRGGHDAQTEPRSAQKTTTRCAKSRMLERERAVRREQRGKRRSPQNARNKQRGEK